MHSDFVSFHVPLTDTTQNMINSSRIRLLKNGVVLLNFARDGIIDNQALAQAMTENKVFAYVTDFPSAQLKGHPRVISLPHLGASTREAEENCAVMIVKQVRDFLENGSIANSVNFPNLEVPQNHTNARIAIVNANVPNMVAQISSKLAAAGLNIVSLLNKSRDDIAYTVIDVHHQVNHHVLDQIAGIEGIMQVRPLMAMQNESS